MHLWHDHFILFWRKVLFELLSEMIEPRAPTLSKPATRSWGWSRSDTCQGRPLPRRGRARLLLRHSRHGNSNVTSVTFTAIRCYYLHLSTQCDVSYCSSNTVLLPSLSILTSPLIFHWSRSGVCVIRSPRLSLRLRSIRESLPSKARSPPLPPPGSRTPRSPKTSLQWPMTVLQTGAPLEPPLPTQRLATLSKLVSRWVSYARPWPAPLHLSDNRARVFIFEVKFAMWGGFQAKKLNNRG